jgi:hypothetical protein
VPLLSPRRPRTSCLIAFTLFLLPASAGAVPSQIVVFLNSNQKVKEDYPELALFSYYYARTGVSLLGVYAGPRWTYGDVGAELKTGVYGGNGLDTRAIVNTQLDWASKPFSITSFTDWYPTDEVYSYLSAFAQLGPLFGGIVGDLSYKWGRDGFTTYAGGPTIGAGTKTMYLGITYLTDQDRRHAIRMTVGLTFLGSTTRRK